MGEFIDKAKGTANEALGRAKVAVGRQVNDSGLVASGAKQQIKGKAQKVAGAIKGSTGDKI